MMNVFLSLLFSLVSAHAKPVSVDPSFVPRIRAACETQLSRLSAAKLRKLNSTPADYCECVAKNHELWAQNDIGNARRAHAYLSTIVALWTPLDPAEFERVHEKYPGESENDSNYTTRCAMK